MNIIEVDVEKTKLFSIGQQYNNNALAIHFVNLPNQKNKYIYYKIDDIEKEIPLVSDLFIVSRPLTLHSGEVKAQIIVRDETNETIELTKNFTMRIQPSNYSGIGEDENYPDDPNIKNYFVKIDEKVNSFEELANLVQTKLDNGDFVGEQGPKGEKGDPGDVTGEYRNLASQIAQNALDAKNSATNAQISESNAKKILDDTKEFANQTKSEMNQIKTDTNTLKEEANASATNAKTSEDKAKEYADNLQASTDDISKLKEDIADLYGAFNSPDNNILEISSENFGKQSASGVEVVYTDNGINISNNTNGYFWYIFDTEIGKEYEVNFDVNIDLEDANFGSSVNKNYAYPGIPDQPGNDVISKLIKDGTHYSTTFTATSDHCMLVFRIRYFVKSLSITNISCIDLSINTTPSIKATSLPVASNDSLGGVKIGEGLIIDESGVLAIYKEGNPTKYNGNEICVFNKILCIGDSLTQGVFNTSSTEAIVRSEYSYPTMLTKLTSIPTMNWGIGGYTSTQWWAAKENVSGWSGFDAVIICLGTNDSAKNNSVENLISAYTSIINKAKAENPKVKIFISSLMPFVYYPYVTHTVNINNAIKNIANTTADCYLADLTTYSDLKRGTGYVRGHLTATGYYKEAKEIASYISYIIASNLDDFMDVQFTNIDYEYTGS